ncbi:MAG: hypothetical protein QM528_09145 [Phycisphaerales bacterium]|nr:hypothetical protein [Phycisphaerales bacterium]
MKKHVFIVLLFLSPLLFFSCSKTVTVPATNNSVINNSVINNSVKQNSFYLTQNSVPNLLANQQFITPAYWGITDDHKSTYFSFTNFGQGGVPVIGGPVLNIRLTFYNQLLTTTQQVTSYFQNNPTIALSNNALVGVSVFVGTISEVGLDTNSFYAWPDSKKGLLTGTITVVPDTDILPPLPSTYSFTFQASVGTVVCGGNYTGALGPLAIPGE